MTNAQFIQDLRVYHLRFTKLLDFNQYSARNFDLLSSEFIAYLQNISAGKSLKSEINLCISRIQAVNQKAQDIQQQLQPSHLNIDSMTYHELSPWYQQVIGGSEGAINELIEYLGNS